MNLILNNCAQFHLTKRRAMRFSNFLKYIYGITAFIRHFIH